MVKRDITSVLDDAVSGTEQTQPVTAVRLLIDQFGRSTALIATSTALARFVGLGAALFGAVILQPRQLGVFALLAATAAVMSAMGVLGFAPLTTRAVAAAVTEEEKRSVARFSLACAASMTIVVAAVCCAAVSAGLLPAAFSDLSGPFNVVTVGVWSLFTGINPLLLAIITGHRGFRTVTRMTLLRAVLVGAGLVFGSVSGSGAGAALGCAVGEGLTCLTLWLVCRRFEYLGDHAVDWSWRKHRNILPGAAAAGGASLLIQLAMWLAQVLLARTPGGLAETGAFLLATRLSLIVTLVPNSLATTILPSLSKNDVPDGARIHQMRGILLGAALVAGAMALPLALIAIFWISVLGSGYRQYGDTVALMAFVGVLVALNNLISSMAIARHRVRLWVASDVLLAAVLLGLSALWAARWGANGIVLATGLAYATSILVLIPILRLSRASRRVGESIESR